MSLLRLLAETKRLLPRGTVAAIVAALLLLPLSLLAAFSGLRFFNPYGIPLPILFLIVLPAGSVAVALQLAGPLAAYGLAALGEKPRFGDVLRLALGRTDRLVPMVYLFFTLFYFGSLVSKRLLGQGATADVALAALLLISARYLMLASASAVLESRTTFLASFPRAYRLGRGNFAMLFGASALQLVTLYGFSLAARKLDAPGWMFWVPTTASCLVTQALAAAAYAVSLKNRGEGPEAPDSIVAPKESRRRHLAALALLLLLPALPSTFYFFEKTGAELLKWSARHRHTLLLKALPCLGAHVSPIHEAATEGKTEEIQTLIAMGENVNVLDFYGRTPLMEAARGNHPEIVRLLLGAGAEVNAETQEGHTALTEAAEHGDAGILKLLLKAGANPNAKNQDFDEETPLILAAKRGNSEGIQALIEAGGDVNRTASFEETALMYAAERGDVRSVQALLEAGANVNAGMTNGWTALMDGARTGGPDTVRVLLRAGADPNALYATADTECQSVLMVAAEDGAAESVRALIQAGADVNARRIDGFTGLMAATASGDPEKVRILLNAGADIHAADRSGATALRLAREKGHREIESLLRAAKSTNARTPGGHHE